MAAAEAGDGAERAFGSFEMERPRASTGLGGTPKASTAVGERPRSSTGLSERRSRGSSSVPQIERDRAGSLAFSFQAAAQLGESVDTIAGGLSANDAIVTVIINATGVGLVLFPKVMGDMGVLMAPLLCAICALTCLQCGVMLSTACTVAEQLNNGRVATYEAVAEVIGGSNGKYALAATKNFALLGIVTVYVQLFVDSASSMLGVTTDEMKLALRFFIAFPAFSALGMLKDLTQLARLSTLGIAAVLVECGSIVFGGLVLFFQTPLCGAGVEGVCNEFDILPPIEIHQLPGAIGKYLAVFLFSYAILATVPSLRSQLAEPLAMHSVLNRSFGCLVVSNCLVMSMGYIGFGKRVSDNIIQSLAEPFPILGKVASGAIVINLLISAPLQIFCIVTAFEASGESAVHTPFTGPNIVFRVGLVLLLCVIGAMLPYITEVIGIVSSVFACCNNILWPMAFHYAGRQQANISPAHPHLRAVKYAGSFIVGVIVLVFGFTGSVTALLEKIEKSRQEAQAAGGVASLMGSVSIF